MGKINSRQKGAAGEREAAKVWNRVLGILTAKRGQQRSGLEQADVVDVSDRFHIEVKRYHAFGIWKFVEQMRRDSDPDQIPVLQFRPDGDKDWHVAVSMDDLVPFSEEIVNIKKGTNDSSDQDPQEASERDAS